MYIFQQKHFQMDRKDPPPVRGGDARQSPCLRPIAHLSHWHWKKGDLGEARGTTEQRERGGGRKAHRRQEAAEPLKGLLPTDPLCPWDPSWTHFCCGKLFFVMCVFWLEDVF